MAAVLQFDSERARARRKSDQGAQPANASGEMGMVIIFPGVRIERSDLDLSHRLIQVARAGGPIGTRPGDGASGSPAGKP